MIDWSKYQNFSEDEFRCNCGCGRADMTEKFMDKLQALRTSLDEAITINKGGGYRCPNHPDEINKDKPGSHTQGNAGDIRTPNSGYKYRLKKQAYALGFVGIGDGKTFTHLDVGHDHADRPANLVY